MADEEDKSQTQKLRARMKLAKNATMSQLDMAKMGLMRMTSKGNLYEPSSKGTVTFEGFLYKKSPGGIPLMRHWHKRWFVLESPGKLLYFTGQDKLDLKGIIPLDMVEKMLFRSTRLTLLMEGSDGGVARKFTLKADSADVVKTCVAAINKAFEELDLIEEQEDMKVEDIAEGDAKYWKPETRKKLNLSVALGEKPSKKKSPLKIDPRAKEIEANLAQQDHKDASTTASSTSSSSAPHNYVPLNDDYVAVAPPVASSSNFPEVNTERQRAQEEADLVATS